MAFTKKKPMDKKAAAKAKAKDNVKGKSKGENPFASAAKLGK